MEGKLLFQTHLESQVTPLEMADFICSTSCATCKSGDLFFFWGPWYTSPLRRPSFSHPRRGIEMIFINVALALKDTLSLMVLPGLKRVVHEKWKRLVPSLVYGGLISDFLVCQCQALQDVQGQQVPVHADGSLSRWRALDNSQGQVSFKKLLSSEVEYFLICLWITKGLYLSRAKRGSYHAMFNLRSQKGGAIFLFLCR